MPIVNVLEAKTHLSRLIDDVESGREPEIIIARNGKPAVRIAPLEQPRRGVRTGSAKGRWKMPDPDPAFDEEIARLFYAGDDKPSP